jgi:C1A family cysteine protease
MKRILYFILIMVIMGMSPVTRWIPTGSVMASTIDVYLNNQKVVFNADYGVPFIDQSNRTLIPFRAVLEAFGANVQWIDNTKVAVATKGSIEVRVPIEKNHIIRNTKLIQIDTKAVIINKRTYIPIRAVMEAFGSNVEWIDSQKRINVTYGAAPIISRLPESYDLRNIGKVTPIKDQLDIGACWAFATLGAIESSLLPGQVFDFSEDHISLNHGYNLTQNEGGDFQISLAYLARWSGPVLESEDPYGDGKTNPNLKASVHVQEAIILPSKDYSAIKRAIMKYGGVQTSIHIRDIAQQELGDAYNPTTYAFFYKGQSLPNHDVVIVGWDDTYSATNFTTPPQRNGAFICRNSYGTTFGDKGYFYVSYDDVLIGKENIVYTKIESNKNYDNIYQSDWLGWVGRIGFGKDTAFFSNVYTTNKKETLEAISFYATDMDTSYEVYVVDKFESEADFAKKRLITRGSFDYAGYYTVKFSTAIPIEGTFAVIVKVTTPDSLYPVAAEYDKDVPWLEDVDISDGRGYMSFDGLSWESTEKVLESNVCLKAFTKN